MLHGTRCRHLQGPCEDGGQFMHPFGRELGLAFGERAEQLATFALLLRRSFLRIEASIHIVERTGELLRPEEDDE